MINNLDKLHLLCHNYLNKMENQKDFKVNRYFFLAIIFTFAILLLMSVLQFFTAFLGAVIFYVLSKRFVEWLVKKKHWRKSMAALLIIVISFLVILLPVATFVILLYNRVSVIASNPADILSGIKHFESTIQQKFNIQLFSDKSLDTVKGYAASILTVILSESLGFFSTILMMYFFLYFMLINLNRMEAAIIFYLPFKRDKINMFSKELVAQTFSNAVGVPVIAIAQGIFAFICYTITGVHEPGFWGVITAFASIIPIVGAGIVWIPISVYLFITGANWQGFFVLAWSAVLVGSIDNIIRFALAKRMADVHPIVTVLGVIVGLKYFGFPGLIFGPLLISFFIILLRIYYLEYQKPLTPLTAKPLKKRQLVPTYIQPFLGIRKVKRK